MANRALPLHSWRGIEGEASKGGTLSYRLPDEPAPRSSSSSLFLLPLPTRAQWPAADWRTLATPHFRVHYPPPPRPGRAAPRRGWSRSASGWWPRSATTRRRWWTCWSPIRSRTPTAQALPILGWPRMILWTSPPGPESELGHYGDWTELLITHEETHLVHLLRPSRNPARQLLARLLPVGPIPLAAPRWVLEGYATVVEGRLTGSGRPNGDLRAAILRRWAQEGKLPSYAPPRRRLRHLARAVDGLPPRLRLPRMAGGAGRAGEPAQALGADDGAHGPRASTTPSAASSATLPRPSTTASAPS